MNRTGLTIAALLTALAVPAAAQRSGPAAGVVPGVEVLLRDSMHLVRGKRVGLITNHSGRDRKGTSTIDLLFRAPGVKLTALYAPEHGIRGAERAGARIASTVDSATGVPVYSIYGDTRVPTPEMLKDVDVVVYDIQDVGARVYTYEWSMALSAAAVKKPFIVLDRPDPIRADIVEGNILEKKFASFVGQFPVSLRYGMTPGELLRFLVGTKEIEADVHVVPMAGYRRSMWYGETKLPWVNPSPNLRNLDASLLYPGTVFFEGTSATEGRGTDDPFAQVGAPWLTDAAAIAAELNAKGIPGVRFDTVTRAVEGEGLKFAGQTIPMIKIRVTDRNQVRAVETGIRLLRAIYARHKSDFTWRSSLERLAGTEALKAAVEQGREDALIRAWSADAATFAARIKPYLIYR